MNVEQITAVNEKLATDEAFRKQYTSLWEQQRTYSVYLPAAEVEEQHNPKLNAAAKASLLTYILASLPPFLPPSAFERACDTQACAFMHTPAL